MITDKIKIALTEAIDRGEFAPGSRLPSRHQLMKRFGIARATIDKALSDMARLGLVHSVRGGGTYVSGGNSPQGRHLYMITPSSGWGFPNHAEEWRRTVEEMHHRSAFSILSFREMERRFLQARTQDARLVWDCPGLQSYSLIDSFRQGNTPQILINRPHHDHNFAATDTRKGLVKMLAAVRSIQRANRAGVLGVVPLPDRPFLTEREVYFHELAAEMGFRVERVVRAKSHKSEDLAEAVREYFSHPGIPPVLFIPEITFHPQLTMMVKERNLPLGRKMVFLFTDKADSQQGVYSLEQNISVMYRQALQWALADVIVPMRSLVEPILHCPPDIVSP